MSRQPDDRAAQDRATAKFIRGLTIGAFIGAIIAGSRLWTRFRRP
jgi:hypothetical protein